LVNQKINGIRIYPHPTNKQIIVGCDTDYKSVQLEISNISGQSISNKNGKQVGVQKVIREF